MQLAFCKTDDPAIVVVVAVMLPVDVLLVIHARASQVDAAKQ